MAFAKANLLSCCISYLMPACDPSPISFLWVSLCQRSSVHFYCGHIRICFWFILFLRLASLILFFTFEKNANLFLLNPHFLCNLVQTRFLSVTMWLVLAEKLWTEVTKTTSGFRQWKWPAWSSCSPFLPSNLEAIVHKAELWYLWVTIGKGVAIMSNGIHSWVGICKKLTSGVLNHSDLLMNLYCIITKYIMSNKTAFYKLKTPAFFYLSIVVYAILLTNFISLTNLYPGSSDASFWLMPTLAYKDLTKTLTC